MSFSADVKSELSHIEPDKKCCMLAEIAGFFRVSSGIRLLGGGKFAILASTENPAVARHFKKLIKDYFGVTASLEVGESQSPGKHKGKWHRYTLRIDDGDKSERILRETGMLMVREGDDYLSDGIYFPIVKTKCCKRAFLRGIFLGCGTVSDPIKSYHMEFVVATERLALDLKKLIGSFVDLSANVSERKENYVVYIKRAGYISDMLGIMGANTAMLNFVNIKIDKGIRGDAVRITNCDTANVDRTLKASEAQVDDIKVIEAAGHLSDLEPSLREVALMRLERPDANLTEIGEALSSPIKKSGVNKRFAKIKEIADSLRSGSK